jgi:hypothetical protein
MKPPAAMKPRVVMKPRVAIKMAIALAGLLALVAPQRLSAQDQLQDQSSAQASSQSQPPPAPQPQSPTDAKLAPQSTADAKPAEPTSPVPSTESWITGSIDFGYRWLTDAGSFPTYRTFVDLGAGPKLLGAEFTITDPKHRAFDYIKVRATGWGDDPYETAHIDAAKSGIYDFSADYRDIAYFNALPSYADPLLARGVVLDEQTFDTRRRYAGFRLDLRPGSWLIPYLAFDRDSGSGSGVTTFVTDANEFPVPNTLRDETNLYRAGVRIELKRFHVTLEEGGTTFKDDQSVFQGSLAQNQGPTNFGNLLTPVFGETINLTTLLASYGIRGSSTFSKALFTANPLSWLDVYGQFLFSQPQTTVNYQQNDTGNLLLESQLLFYTSQAYLVSAASKLPHTTGSFGAEMRPLRRVRVVESWLTDRLHNAGSASSLNQLSSPAISGPGVLQQAGSSEQIAALLSSSLVTNYNQAEADVFFDATSKLMLRGGYRYVWGDAIDAVLPPAGLISADQARLRRNVGIGGLTYRPVQKLSITAEAEIASSGGAYFRTSLYNYQKIRAQARYQALKTLSVSADFNALVNENPTAGMNYSYRVQQESLSLFWSPGKSWDLEGSYTRSTLSSEIGYLTPQDLASALSIYRDDAHSATALFNWKLPGVGKLAAGKLTAGGSMFLSSGSIPTRYFQPLVTILVPAGKHVSWFGEWRYYGYAEPFTPIENFRAQLITTGLRLSR